MLVMEDRARVDHAIAEEGLEEVVPPIVVLAHDALVLRFGVDCDFGNHSREEELQMLFRQREADEIAPRVEKPVHVGDVHGAVEVGLEEGVHRDLAGRVARGELLVVEDDEIGQLGHGFILTQALRAKRDRRGPQ
jgi:hypothetical protein